jgi:MFS family permease
MLTFVTEKVSWRWCFYINLPIGGVAILVIFLLLNIPAPPQRGPPLTKYQQFRKLDPIGTAFFMPGVICILLALQWGGGQYAWKNARIIALLVLGSILLIIFLIIQLIEQENASIPPRVMKNRTVSASMLFSLCIGGMMMTIVYYIVSNPSQLQHLQTDDFAAPLVPSH